MKRTATLLAVLGVFLWAPIVLAGGDACDYNGDGVVDDVDRQALMNAASQQATEGHPLWNPQMDHDGDGVISLVDLSKFLELQQ